MSLEKKPPETGVEIELEELEDLEDLEADAQKSEIEESAEPVQAEEKNDI